MNLNNTAMEENKNSGVTTPPISQEEFEKDKQELTREEFMVEYMESTGASEEEAQEMANDIYRLN